MKTIKAIVYSAAPYGKITTIPKGTTLIPASNLPNSDGKFYAKKWKGMSEKAKSWERNYGFLITLDEAVNGTENT